MRAIMLSMLAITLISCATPQDKAISQHCNNEGMIKYPQNWVISTQETTVQVGHKVIGTRQVCETEVSKAGDKKHSSELSVRTCRNEDLIEPIYEKRNVPVNLDTNDSFRRSHIGSCISNSKASGMYRDLK